MQSETVDEAIYVQQAELLVDLLSTFKPFFIKGISEYALIELLKKAPYQFFDEDALRDPLILFKTHFVLFHALYQLKRDWRERNEGELDIHALNISLKPIDKSDAE
ncbi:MAG: DNA-J related domain-containing protein, partial [Pseudomonadota bacterium]|nr:DNA-J related domain-containing protein [Pseudomonadota bacterium]